MTKMIYGGFYWLIGCCLGSFLSLCAVRLQREESLWSPRSHCDSCGHSLELRELVPLAGYFVNNGRCRYCGAPIPVAYFWQEVVAGFLFLLVGLQTGTGLLLLVRWVILALLLLLSFLDLKELQLYEELFYPLGLLFLAYRYLAGFPLGQGFLGALVLGGGMELLRRWKPQSLGAGDPKLVGLLGFWLGVLPGGESLLWAVVSSFLFVLWRCFRAPKGQRMAVWCAPIPFGPFLCGAAFFVDCRQWGLPFDMISTGSLSLVLGTLELSGTLGLEQLKSRAQAVLRRLQPWPRAVLSVVLGEKKLVLLQGQRQGSQWEVERYLEMVWPERLQPSLKRNQAEPVALWLQEVCAKRGFTAKHVNLSLASEWTELRELALPGLSWKQQQEEASWEIRQQAAAPEAGVTFSLRPHPAQQGQLLAEILLEARSTFLFQLTELLDWKLLRVEPLAQSWSRWIQGQEMVLLLLREPERIAYGWYEKGCLTGTGLFSPDTIPPVDKIPEQVLLGGVKREELTAWKSVLEQEWGCPVGFLEETSLFHWAPCYEERKKYPFSSSLYGALGGLMPDGETAGFHFPLQGEENRTGPELLPLLAKGSLAAAFCLLLTGAGMHFYWSGQKAFQQERLQAAAGWEKLWQEAQKRQKLKKWQKEQLQQLEQKRLPMTPFLTLLGNTLPADCQLTRLQQEESRQQPGFSLEGRSLKREAVLQFVKRLQKQPSLTDIHLEQLEEQPEELVPVRFALHGQWKAGSHES